MEMQLRTYTIHLFVNCMVVDLVYGRSLRRGESHMEGETVESCPLTFSPVKSCPFMNSLVQNH